MEDSPVYLSILFAILMLRLILLLKEFQLPSPILKSDFKIGITGIWPPEYRSFFEHLETGVKTTSKHV